MEQTFNVIIKSNTKEWLVFCKPVCYEDCKSALLKLSKKYSNIRII